MKTVPRDRVISRMEAAVFPRFFMHVLIIIIRLDYYSCAMMNVNLSSTTPSDIQQNAVLELIRRTLPSDYGKFLVTIDAHLGPEYRNTFRLQNVDSSSVGIVGNDGVSAAWGFHYYLKHFCHCHISWEGRQLNLPKRLPRLPDEGVEISSKDQLRYYANVCTFSYSFVWWKWPQWEAHIDWMAMNSINLPLAFTAQEAIWRKVYVSLGFTQQELDSHFTGPAFLAWGRMGNLRGWGGPLPESWYSSQLQLQKRIIQRMREFGMITVLPGFAGHVPEAVTRVFPNVTVTRLSQWSNFNSTYSGLLLLDPSNPLFKKISNLFITKTREEFGSDHVYNVDPFNEMIPASREPEFLRKFGQGVFSALTSADSEATWMLQGWMFHSSPSYWQEPQVRAFLTSVPIGKMIILDLYSEQNPLYGNYSSYYGQPFIWCMLLNFGGALGYFGEIESVNKGPANARSSANSSMVGLGLTMEGIFQNYVMYDFFLEKAYTDEVDVKNWMTQYARRRYGRSVRKLAQFWQKASETVLNNTVNMADHGQFIIMKRPTLHGRPFVWYEPRSILFMWRKMLQAGSSLAFRSLFQYDLVDITRQALSVASVHIYRDVCLAYRRKNLTKLTQAANTMLNLFSDLDEILGSNEHFLLGKWLADAKQTGKLGTESTLYEFNARNQITLWGPNGEIIDYAKKQWSGLVSDYYKPRWQLFLTNLTDAVKSGTRFNQDVFKRAVLNQVERPFSYYRKVYPTFPTGDSLSISQRLLESYQRYLTSHKVPDFNSKSRVLHGFAEPRKRKRLKPKVKRI